MTELAIRDDRRAVEVQQPRLSASAPSAAISTLADWAAELRAAGDLAKELCGTPFVPAHFRGKPADAAAAILTGFEVGLSPMASLKSIFMIGGTPGMYAKTMVAIVQAQGHEVWPEEQSDTRVIVCGRRKGWPADRIVRTVWDTARVVQAKLTSNAKYRENPQQMMWARGSSEICRQVAPDALLGIPYSVEELESIDSPIRAEVVPTAPVTAAEILGIAAKAEPAIEQQEAGPVTPPPAPAQSSNLPLPLAERVAKAIVAFSGLGVSAERIEAKVGRPRADWTEHDLAALTITHQQLRKNEIDGEAEFPTLGEAATVTTTDSFVDTSGPMSPKQRSKMFALFGKFDDLANRHEQLAYIADKLDYEVESRGALTASEAAIVIDKLESYEAQEQPPAGDPA